MMSSIILSTLHYFILNNIVIWLVGVSDEYYYWQALALPALSCVPALLRKNITELFSFGLRNLQLRLETWNKENKTTLIYRFKPYAL